MQAISGLLTFERDLLEKFRDDFDFFGANEYNDLTRLREDRNRCAHPTFLKTELSYEPNAELARLHIRNALTLVLTQEPKQGKAALSEIQSVIISKYFPDKVQDACSRLEAAGIRSARPALINAVIDDLIFGTATKSHPYFKKTIPYVAIDAIIEMRRLHALPRAVNAVKKLLLRTEDESIDTGSIITLRNSDISTAIDHPSQLVIKSWIEKSEFPFAVSIVKRGISISWCKPSALKRLEALPAEEVGKATGELPNEILQRAADIYASARSWHTANDLAEKCTIPLADRFQEEHIRFIFDQGRNGKADLPGSSGFIQFIAALYKESPIGKNRLDELTEEFSYERYRPD